MRRLIRIEVAPQVVFFTFYILVSVSFPFYVSSLFRFVSISFLLVFVSSFLFGFFFVESFVVSLFLD